MHRKKSYFLWSKSPFHWIEVVTRNKSRMSESISEDSLSNKNLPTKYKMYPIRWLVLLTIFLFNLSNNLLWISFSAVSTKGNIRLVSYDIDDILSTWHRMNIQQKNLFIMMFSWTLFSKSAAEYYGRSIDDIDWLSSIGFFVGIPSVLIGSWGINRYGLRYTWLLFLLQYCV